jgi:hypothetical protein
MRFTAGVLTEVAVVALVTILINILYHIVLWS